MYLLDTHTLLWAVLNPSALSRRAAAILPRAPDQIFVSAASAWEIATKVRLGKLPEAEIFEREFMQLPARTGFTILPIDVELALRAGRLAGQHRDPFDRMIAAQALALDMTLLSSDEKLDEFGVRRVW